jgi:hypothetical protein
MTQHPSAALLRAGCEAFAKRDLATLAKLFAEDVVDHVAGRRFDRQPEWLPVNARAQAAMGVSMRKGKPCGKERDHAAV